ncbi:MAG: MBL fold metallo-hydrolase [Steroidobacteraceae bacterium]|jgi:N-acyl-phosphatidylethanolamine-hydrolysing phospholipase D
MASPPHHHTARGFRNNYVGSVTKSLGEVLCWQIQRVRAGLPPAPRVPTPSQTADLEFIERNARPPDMVPAVTWIGHASALVQADGLNVLTDPIFSRRASPLRFMGPARAQPPGLRLDELPHIDVVVISHNHYDHLDRDSIRSLSRQPGGAPLFLAPLGLKAWLLALHIENAVELDWWQHHVHGGVDFHCTPAQHWSARSVHDRNRTLWCAWSVLGADCHWFFSGDTGYSRDFADTRRQFASRQSAAQGGGFDLALIAIGACLPRWFMGLQHVDLPEAVQVHLDLGAKRSLGVHWGTFSLSDEPLDQPIHELAAARIEKGVTEAEFFIVPIGATRRIAPRSASGTPGT